MHVFNRLRTTVPDDLLAGLTGAVAGAPQAMGFAIIAGVSPIYGLYTAVVSTIVAALTGASTYMTVGPTNALALVVGSTLVRFDTGTHVERMIVLTLLVGVFQLAFGVLRLGNLTRFVSNAVMTGFITGAGVLIILGQLRHMNGYAPETRETLPRFWEWLRHLGESDLRTVIVGLVALIIIAYLRRTRVASLATLTGIAIASGVVALTGWQSVTLVQDISAIPGGFPTPTVPELSYVPDLGVAALALAVLASVQSAALTQNVPEPDGSTPSVTRDLIGQGLANLVGSLFQNMPAGGSLSRTAVSMSAGAKTRFANVFAGLFVLSFVLVFGGLVEQIALAALAGQLIVAALTLIRPDSILLVWRVSLSARVAMTATFVSTLILPLEYSVYVGVAISVGLYVYTSAQHLHVVRIVPTTDNHFREEPVPDHLPPHETVIFSIAGHLFFGAVQRLEEALPVPTSANCCTVVILRLRDNDYLGSTGIRFLQRYADQLEAQGGKLLLAGIGSTVLAQMERAGVLESFGRETIFTARDTVFAATEDALAYGRAWLAGEAPAPSTGD